MTIVYQLTNICVFLTFISDCIGTPRVDPLVNTNLGLIRGVRSEDGDYSMFMGIPYAQVSNPFGAAIPQEPFNDVFEANDDSAICPQIEEFTNTIVGSLDCLHLNIYVPTIANSRNKVPVLVWIHGGGFSYGYAGRYIYGPKFIVRHDIILVTLNYRLGPYGFMCLDIPEIPGNEGLKDQLLALRWVNNNIEAFGGDSNKITVFGESAGARSVDFHILSPQEKLFNQAIMQSGVSMGPVYSEPHKNAPQMLAIHLGYSTDDLNEAIEFLTSVDTSQVISASDELGLIFRPCLEKHFDDIEGFITENWIEASVPKVIRMPILFGFNDDEKLGDYINKPSSYFDNLNIFYDKLSFGFDVDSPDFNGMEEIMRRFYIGDEDISENHKHQIADFESDFTYYHPAHRSISRYLSNNVAKIYLYVFSHTGARNFGQRNLNITDGSAGAVHADEIGYLFDTLYYNDPPNPEDQLIIDRITTLWANFVKYGNPTPEITDLLPVTWTPITKNSLLYYLDINSELYLGVRPFHKRMAFWDLFYRTNEKLQRIYKGSE